MVRNIFASLMMALLLCGCGGGSGSSSPPAVTLTSINVTTTSPIIAAGTTAQFKATGIYSDNSSQDLTASVAWVSSPSAVATINNLGVVTALSAGSSTISAASGAISGHTTLTVAALQSITVTPATPAVGIIGTTQGTTQQLSAVGNFANGSQNLTNFTTTSWNSSSPGIASISASGLTTAAGPGQTQITASFGGVTSPAVPLTVKALQSLAVTPANTTVDAGASLAFTATGTFSDTTTQILGSQVTWTSDHSAIVSITANSGSATALSPGTSNIGAAFLGIPATPVAVTVLGPNLITVTPANQSIVAGATLPFTATGTFADGTKDLTNLVTWISTVPGVATISNTAGSRGVATAGANTTGTTVISASLGSAPPGSASLTVNTLATLAVTPTNPSVTVGSVLHLTATGTFTGNLPQQDLTNAAIWTSNSPSVATVSNLSGTKGLVTAVAVGSATVTATIGGKTANSKVTVSTTAVTSPTNRAYVTNFGSNTLSVIDTVGLTLLSPDITVGSGPRGVALINTTPATSRAYVANSDGTLSVIDLTTNSVVASVPLGGGGGSWGVAVIPALNRVYVANSFGNTLTVVDTTTNTVVTNVAVGAGPRGVAVDPSGSRVYVANAGDNTVSVIDAGSNLVLTTIGSVGLSAPQDIVFNSVNSRLYVVNSFSNVLSVINPTASTFTTIQAGTIHKGIAFNPSTSRAYVSNNDTGTVSTINTTSNTELGASASPIAVGTGPLGIAVDVANNRVYVANFGSSDITVINTAGDSNSVLATIPVGNGPFGIAVLP